jgi:hypothetical protein
MTVNDDGRTVIQLSEEKLQRFGWILLGAAIFFILLGAWVSPVDAEGKPVLLLPEVKEVEDYRTAAQAWIAELAGLDAEIARILSSGQQGDLFSQSRSAQQALQHAVDLAQQIDRTKVPPVAAGVQEKLISASLGYLEVARSAVQWISAPEKNNLDAAVQKLTAARKLRSGLEVNSWLKSR